MYSGRWVSVRSVHCEYHWRSVVGPFGHLLIPFDNPNLLILMKSNCQSFLLQLVLFEAFLGNLCLLHCPEDSILFFF